MLDTFSWSFSAAARGRKKWAVVLRELSVVEQRYQAVLTVLEDGLSVTEAAAKVGCLGTLHAWLARYAEDGLEQLVDRSHRPRSCPHQVGPAVEVRLVELRQLHPTSGPDRLLYRLPREGLEPLPSRAAVGRALAGLGLVEPRRGRPWRATAYRERNVMAKNARTHQSWHRGRACACA